jgi:hypothetical protein
MVRPVNDEHDGLLSFLAHQRHLVRVAVHGVSDAQAASTPSASSLSLGGLVKHVASVEQYWMDIVLQRSRPQDGSYDDSFRLLPGETMSDVLDLYADVATQTEEIIAGIADMGRTVAVPPGVPWFPPDVTAWSVRWVLLHLIEETARHAGHADIIRETLDGATALPLMAAVEAWPPTPWVRPWRPAYTARR